MSREKDITKGLEQLFQGILEGNRRETENNYGEVIDKFVNETGDLFKSPSKFSILIHHRVNDVFEECLRRVFPDLDEDKFYKLSFIFLQHKLVEHQLEEIIMRREGMACSSDKSGWLINSYLVYLLKGKLPDMEVEEKCFWKPHFGTAEQWIEFIDSLMNFYHGNSIRYMKSVAVLSGIGGE